MLTANRLRIRRSLDGSGLSPALVDFCTQQVIRLDEIRLHSVEDFIRRGLSRPDAETLYAFGQKVRTR